MIERLRKLWNFGTLLEVTQVVILVSILLVALDVIDVPTTDEGLWSALALLFFFKLMDLREDERNRERQSDNFNLHLRLKDLKEQVELAELDAVEAHASANDIRSLQEQINDLEDRLDERN